MAVHGSFNCAFTRRNCSHEALFAHEYQRTNRTKENKILRCFPHCCPEHVIRSYCGSSLHLQVDFVGSSANGEDATSAVAFPQPERDDDLMVFGRFRPNESRGFDVGDDIAGASILSSLQSEDNPTGEWIEAWLIASADHNAWLFEVNHSARWYYNWGSSAAKDKRLKEHVFEVYVLYQASAASSDSFRVAAVVCSPRFKLLSFRRAPPTESRKREQEEAAVVNAANPLTTKTGDGVDNVPRPRLRTNNSGVGGVGGPSPSTTSHPQPPALPAPAMIAYSHSHSHSGSGSAGLRGGGGGSPAIAAVVGASESTRAAKRPRPSLDSRWPPHIETRGRVETRQASPSHHTVDSHSLGGRTSRRHTQLDDLVAIRRFVEQLPLAAVAEALPSIMDGHRQYTGGRSSVSTARHLQRLLLELGETPRQSNELAEVAAHLGLWLAFDPRVLRTLAEFHRHAAASLLVRSSLVDLHEQSIVWLHSQVEGYLGRCGWSVDEFVDAVLVTTTQRHHQYHRQHRYDGGDCVDDASDDGSGLSFADFVAQAREIFATSEQQWWRLRQRSQLQLQASTGPTSCRVLDRTNLFNGVWRCELESVQLRRYFSDTGSGFCASVQSLLWFWKQFDNVHVSLQPDCSAVQPAVLEIVSMTNEAAGDEGLRLVLDGRARWFRSFPSGDCTSGVSVGGQSFGDYKAVYVAETNSVECVLFSWPVSGGMCAYCWRFVIQPQPGGAVHVQLMVECGSLAASDGVHDLSTTRLETKMDLVRQWNRVLVAGWMSERFQVKFTGVPPQATADRPSNRTGIKLS